MLRILFQINDKWYRYVGSKRMHDFHHTLLNTIMDYGIPFNLANKADLIYVVDTKTIVKDRDGVTTEEFLDLFIKVVGWNTFPELPLVRDNNDGRFMLNYAVVFG